MNRRKFLTSLAAVPLAPLVAAAGVNPAWKPAKYEAGVMTFAKLEEVSKLMAKQQKAMYLDERMWVGRREDIVDLVEWTVDSDPLRFEVKE